MSDISFLASNTDKRQSRLFHVSPFPKLIWISKYVRFVIHHSFYPLLVLVTASLEKGDTNKQMIQTFNTPGANLCNPALQIGRKVRLASAIALALPPTPFQLH